MSSGTPSTAGATSPAHQGEGPRVAHHFESAEQQFESGKLGMWLFIFQELLFFSGLFAAYAVYRANHPEIFVYAHRFLDVRLGAINTAVLITSSFTAAWAVRAAQLGQRRLLVTLLSATVVLAFVFLGIKSIEYRHKWREGLLWGHLYRPVHTEVIDHPPRTGEAPAPLRPGDAAIRGLTAGPPHDPARPDEPKHVATFFGIYFTMTGLHALHVIIGIGVFFWLIRRALRGDFSPSNFAAVDYAALYWHFVDLVWIYLFPLLYLIH